MGTLNISFVAVRGPLPQSFDKPRGEADRGRGCSSPNPVALSSVLRGLQTRHERSCLVSDVRPALVRGEPDKYLKSGPVGVPGRTEKLA